MAYDDFLAYLQRLHDATTKKPMAYRPVSQAGNACQQRAFEDKMTDAVAEMDAVAILRQMVEDCDWYVQDIYGNEPPHMLNGYREARKLLARIDAASDPSTDQIADSTFEDAYSATRYGLTEWREASRLLKARGFKPDEIRWVLRSKWMRWAADAANASEGFARAEDLAAFLDNPRNKATQASVRREIDRWGPV